MRRSIHIAVMCLMLVFVSSCRKPVEVTSYAIVPAPVFQVQKEGVFVLRSSVTVCFQNLGQNSRTAKYVFSTLRKYHFRPRSVGKDDASAVSFCLNSAVNEELGDEGYLLEVSSEGIKVEANTEKGLFYGFQTFLQMLPEDAYTQNYRSISLPACTILDYPRFEWRGSQLDVATHFFSVKQIKKHLDLMAMYKFNKFLWRLTGDAGWRVEIQAYPQLTDVGAWMTDDETGLGDSLTNGRRSRSAGGFYTQDDVREIVRYAQERHIEVIPEIDIPFHCGALLAACPGLSCRRLPNGDEGCDASSLCMANDSTLVILEQVLDEIVSLFPSHYVHIGGSGFDKSQPASCGLYRDFMAKHHLADENQLRQWFTNEIVAHVESQGCRVVVYNDAYPSGAGSVVSMARHGMSCVVDVANQGVDVVACPTDYCDLSVYQSDSAYQPKAAEGLLSLSKIYRFNPMPDGLDAEAVSHVLGTQIAFPTRYVVSADYAEYMLLPRMCAMAECCWTPLANKDWSFFRRTVERQKDRLASLGYKYCLGSFVPVLHITQQGDKLQVLLQSELPNTEFHYTIDGSDPDAQSPVYSSPLLVPERTRLKVYPAYKGDLRDGVYTFDLK